MRPMEILIVDDDKDDIKLIRRALEKNKIELNIHEAFNGIEAMEFLKQTTAHVNYARPDLVLLDLNMPKKDGRQTLGDIKNDDALKDIPIIILTTSNEEEDIARSYKIGCNCYISKPVDIADFTRAIKSLNEFWFTVVRLPRTA